MLKLTPPTCLGNRLVVVHDHAETLPVPILVPLLIEYPLPTMHKVCVIDKNCILWYLQRICHRHPRGRMQKIVKTSDKFDES